MPLQIIMKLMKSKRLDVDPSEFGPFREIAGIILLVAQR
jgi:hypothetical protein